MYVLTKYLIFTCFCVYFLVCDGGEGCEDLWAYLCNKDAIPDVDECKFSGMAANSIRYECYRKIIFALFGPLGKKNRVKHPDCVVKEIRFLAAEKSPCRYVGFKRPPETAPDSDERSVKKFVKHCTVSFFLF